MVTDQRVRVAQYFDENAAEHDRRYWENPVAQRIRQSFREELKRRPFRRALELGCGTGLDLRHFAHIFPERSFCGMDVSSEMVRVASGRLSEAGVPNARVRLGAAEEVGEVFPDEPFDMVYVFYGALNTVGDLSAAARSIYEVTTPGGHLVLTFVNRWYAADILFGLLKGRWRGAFARLRPTWDGYDPSRPLPSRCYSPSQVRRAFEGEGELVARRGYSILYPAWYRAHRLPRSVTAAAWLWRVDEFLNLTPLWSTGEYALYVFRKRA